MALLRLRNIHTLVTMAEGEKVRHDVDLLVEDGRIAGIRPRTTAADVHPTIDCGNCVVYPGFVNTHHHLYQTLTRNIPKVQNAKLFDWLVDLYEIWRELTPEAVAVSTQVGLGELLLSGCTTTTDHFYVFPHGAPAELLDVEIEAARKMGVRFHPTRGSMSRGRSTGGLPPDDVVQKPDVILKDCDRLIRKYHDPKPFSMCRIVLAPCSPFSVTTELLAETATFAREKKVQMHTHLCETKDEEAYCLQTHDLRPLAYMEKTGWTGPDVVDGLPVEGTFRGREGSCGARIPSRPPSLRRSCICSQSDSARGQRSCTARSASAARASRFFADISARSSRL